MNYTLDQLLALEAVHRLGSFAAAAKSLYRATSAISYSIKSLEEALEVELFDRSGHRAHGDSEPTDTPTASRRG